MEAFFTHLTNQMPAMSYTLPIFGEVDFTPYVLVTALFLGTTLLFYLIQRIVLVQLQKLSARTSSDVDDVVIQAVKSIHPWAYTLLALFIAMQPLTLPTWLDLGLRSVILVVVVWQLIAVATAIVSYAAARMLAKDEDNDGVVDPNAATASEMVTLMARIVLWALGGLFVLSNLGIEITALVAGLGIGGLAVAFALQGILSDLFSSFSLYFDKPFRIGDFIMIGDDMGTVERIGIKTTRIRTLQGEELVVSNAELTSTRVQNFKRMDERRMQFQIGITYETPAEQVEKVPEILRKIIEGAEHVRFDRVHFASYGDSALIFEIVFFVLSSDYNEYMDIRQDINFKIMQAFQSENIDFAYPTQTLYVKK